MRYWNHRIKFARDESQKRCVIYNLIIRRINESRENGPSHGSYFKDLAVNLRIRIGLSTSSISVHLQVEILDPLTERTRAFVPKCVLALEIDTYRVIVRHFGLATAR